MKDNEKIIQEMAIIINGRTETDTMAYYIALNKAKKIYDMLLPEDSVVISREEWKQIKNSLYYSKEELENKLQKERKETVEKILNETMHIPVIEGKFVKVDDLIDKLKELAKQFGVEIKE